MWRGIFNVIKSIPRHFWNWLIQPEGWQVRHFAASPFGASLMTWFWTGQLQFWQHWDTVANMASLGAISYGVIAVLAEGGFRVFYTLSQIGKDREKRRQELEDMKAAAEADGVAAERKRWQQWNEARIQAADEGREFNEPPPGS